MKNLDQQRSHHVSPATQKNGCLNSAGIVVHWVPLASNTQQYLRSDARCLVIILTLASSHQRTNGRSYALIMEKKQSCVWITLKSNNNLHQKSSKTSENQNQWKSAITSIKNQSKHVRCVRGSAAKSSKIAKNHGRIFFLLQQIHAHVEHVWYLIHVGNLPPGKSKNPRSLLVLRDQLLKRRPFPRSRATGPWQRP